MWTRFAIILLLSWKSSGSNVVIKAVPRISLDELLEANNQEDANSIQTLKVLIGDAFQNGNDCGKGMDSKCVPQYKCKDNGQITDGDGLFDPRILITSQNDGNCAALEVCCRQSDQIELNIPPKKPSKSKCGQRNSNGIGFKNINLDKSSSKYGEFPWMMAVLEKLPTNLHYKFKCGGSLIHPRVVMTSAHCINASNINTIKVEAGEWDSQSSVELYPEQIQSVSKIIIHKNFGSRNFFNDIALLVTENPFDLAENIQPICLPSKEETFDLANCVATGWGKHEFGEKGNYPNILKKIDLPIVPRATCESCLRSTRVGPSFKLHESFICAGGEIGKDMCSGDGGSPLVCPIPGSSDLYYQAGIVAWGIGCNSDIPGVYANVAYLRPWIDEQLENVNASLKSYYND